MRNKIVLWFGASLLLIVLAACAPAAVASSNTQVRQISVTGSGQVYVTPDIAYINVGVHSQADTVQEALELNKTLAYAIKDTLVAQGVAETDIQTSNLNVYQQSDYDFQGVITRTYFSADNSVYVTVRDILNIGPILDAVAKSGANNIYGITFDVQDKTEAQTTARQLAVEAARTQAQELADEANVELGEILTISSSYSYPLSSYGYGIGGGGGEAYYSAVPIASGQIAISADVTLTFEIK